MKKGYFSDTGYRFRKNFCEFTDGWWPGRTTNIDSFYDIKFFNSDTV